MNIMRRTWARGSFRGSLCLMVVAACAVPSVAEVPRQIHYQGKLRDAGGAAVTDTITLRTRLYDSLTGGDELFDETHAGVSVTNGLFSVLIGSQSGAVPDSVFAGGDVYLGVAVNGTDLAPRTRLAAAPYTVKAKSAEQLVEPAGGEVAVYVKGGSGNVGIGTTSPDASASLDITSTARGFLPPRMTTAQRDAIVAPAPGLQIFNTTTHCLEFFGGTIWQSLACGCSGTPAIPEPITGLTSVCSGQTGVAYSIASVSGATAYTWDVPPGASVTGGQGTTAITAAFGNSSGDVSVAATNACGAGPQRSQAVTVIPSLPVSVSISADPSGDICEGTNVIFTATPTNGGTSPSYQWKLNGGNVGTDSATYSNASLANSDQVTCVMTSNAPCATGSPATSNVLTMTVGSSSSGSDTFDYTGGPEIFTVPACISSLTIQAYGAQGGTGHLGGTPGNGAYATGTLSVTPGDELTIIVGGRGGDSMSGTCGGGVQCTCGGGGGGCSAIQYNSTYVLVAGGGGGSGARGLSGYDGVTVRAPGNGGHGGNAGGGGDGGDNPSCPSAGGHGGNGGTGTSHGGDCLGPPHGGDGGSGFGGLGSGDITGSNGTPYGTGGASACGGVGGYGGGGGAGHIVYFNGEHGGGGGGGGGHQGGGGGCGGYCQYSGGGGGGGGSSYTGGMTGGTSITVGNRTGDGQVVISW